MEVPFGQIPELDEDLDVQREAGVDEKSIQASYFLKFDPEVDATFSGIERIEKFPRQEGIHRSCRWRSLYSLRNFHLTLPGTIGMLTSAVNCMGSLDCRLLSSLDIVSKFNKLLIKPLNAFQYQRLLQLPWE